MKRQILPQLLTGIAALSALTGCNLGAAPEAPVTYVIITDAPEVLALTGTPLPEGQPVPTLTPIVANPTQAGVPEQSQAVPTAQLDTVEPTRPIPTPVTGLSSPNAPSLDEAHA